MIKALEGPYGHTRVRFIPTGGIHAANMMAYLERPSVIAVGGSWMVERKLIQAADWRQVEQLTRAAVSAAHSLRRHSA
jgi:2-dehydro-3-deoxyphosphogluconate aldolase/(4S)-4-hydroxy-2-oxoglutarate aldolase